MSISPVQSGEQSLANRAGGSNLFPGEHQPIALKNKQKKIIFFTPTLNLVVCFKVRIIRF